MKFEGAGLRGSLVLNAVFLVTFWVAPERFEFRVSDNGNERIDLAISDPASPVSRENGRRKTATEVVGEDVNHPPAKEVGDGKTVDLPWKLARNSVTGSESFNIRLALDQAGVMAELLGTPKTSAAAAVAAVAELRQKIIDFEIENVEYNTRDDGSVWATIPSNESVVRAAKAEAADRLSEILGDSDRAEVAFDLLRRNNGEIWIPIQSGAQEKVSFEIEGKKVFMKREFYRRGAPAGTGWGVFDPKIREGVPSFLIKPFPRYSHLFDLSLGGGGD